MSFSCFLYLHVFQVLATGLSGLYSSLPRKLDHLSDDWHQLTQHDIHRMPDLTMFLNSLEFCNAVVQVTKTLCYPMLSYQISFEKKKNVFAFFTVYNFLSQMDICSCIGERSRQHPLSHP